MRMISYI